MNFTILHEIIEFYDAFKDNNDLFLVYIFIRSFYETLDNVSYDIVQYV